MIFVDFRTLRNHKNMESNHQNIVQGLNYFKQTQIIFNSIKKKWFQNSELKYFTTHKNKHEHLNENLKQIQILMKQYIFNICDVRKWQQIN